MLLRLLLVLLLHCHHLDHAFVLLLMVATAAAVVVAQPLTDHTPPSAAHIRTHTRDHSCAPTCRDLVYLRCPFVCIIVRCPHDPISSVSMMSFMANSAGGAPAAGQQAQPPPPFQPPPTQPPGPAGGGAGAWLPGVGGAQPGWIEFEWCRLCNTEASDVHISGKRHLKALRSDPYTWVDEWHPVPAHHKAWIAAGGAAMALQ